MKKFKIKHGKKTYLVKAADKDSAMDKLVEKGYIEKIEDASKPKYYDTMFGERVRKDYDNGKLTYSNIKEWDKKQNGGIDPIPPFNTKEILDYYLATKRDCNITEKITDSDKLKQLAYEFGQKGAYFDRANLASSRNILGKDDEVKYQDFVNSGFKVYEQLKQEVDNVQKTGRSFGRFESYSDTLKLLKDAVDRLFWASDNVSRATKAKGKALAEKIDNLIKEYWQRMQGIKDDKSPEEKAQEWVDYDLKHLGHVSEETKNDIKKMGLDFDKWDNQVKDDSSIDLLISYLITANKRGQYADVIDYCEKIIANIKMKHLADCDYNQVKDADINLLQAIKYIEMDAKAGNYVGVKARCQTIIDHINKLHLADCDVKPISDCDMSNVEVKDAANFSKYQYVDACKYIDDAWYKITDNVADGILQAVGLTNRVFDAAWTKLKNLIDNDDKLSDADKAELERYF